MALTQGLGSHARHDWLLRYGILPCVEWISLDQAGLKQGLVYQIGDTNVATQALHTMFEYENGKTLQPCRITEELRICSLLKVKASERKDGSHGLAPVARGFRANTPRSGTP